MVDQNDMFDPARHHMPPPVIPIRDGMAPPQQPARPAPPVAPPAEPRQVFREPIQQVQPAYVATAKAVAQILATRVLLMIAVVTASAIWCYAVYDPLQLRIVAASAFSVLGVAPLIWLYHRKG